MEHTLARLRTAPLLVALLLVAGCFGKGGSEGQPDASMPPEVVGEVGSLQGIVVDDAFIAIVGAVVGIPAIGASTTTDAQGHFVLENLPVGSHDVFANKLGYEQVGQRLTVTADAPTDAEFRLPPLAAMVPYTEVVEYIGFMNCGVGADAVLTATAATSACTQDPNHKTSFDFEVRPDVLTAIGELTWTPSAGFAAQALRLALWQNPRCSPCDPEYDYGDVTGTNPVYLRADRFRGISEEDPTQIWWYVWTPWGGGDMPLVIVANQRFSVFGSVFYGSPAPPEYSALPEA